MRRYLNVLSLLAAACVMFLVGFIIVAQRTGLKAIRATLERLDR